MAKKKTAKGQPPTNLAKPRKPKGLDADTETKALAYDEIMPRSAEVDRLEVKYEKSKGIALRDKKAFDTADKELREMIRTYEHGDTDPGLFVAKGEAAEPDGDDTAADPLGGL